MRKPTIENRNSLWFDKFNLRFAGFYPYIHILRNYEALDDEKLEYYCAIRSQQNLAITNSWRMIINRYTPPELNGFPSQDVSEYLYDFIKVCNVLQDADRSDMRVVVNGHSMRVYTNSQDIVDELSASISWHSKNISKVNVVGSKSTVLLRKSNYKYRTIIKRNNALSREKRQAFISFINENNLRASPSFKTWLEYTGLQYQYTQHNFFIDHNDKNIITMLALLLPGLIRETKDIVIVDK